MSRVIILIECAPSPGREIIRYQGHFGLGIAASFQCYQIQKVLAECVPVTATSIIYLLLLELDRR